MCIAGFDLSWGLVGLKGIGLWIVVVLLAGCQSKQDENIYTIGFSQCTMGDSWREAMDAEMKRELIFHPNLRLISKDAQGISAQQINDIQSLVGQGIDLLIVSPNEAEPITPVVEQVYRKGIPVIILDRRTNSDAFNAYVGGDNLSIGAAAGKFITRYLAKQGTILEIWGLPGSTPAQERHKGFDEVLAGYPDIKQLDPIYGNWEASGVDSLLPDVLDTYQNIDLIFAHNDRMARATVKWLKAKGRMEQIKVIGVDGLPGSGEGLEMVEDSQLLATFTYPTGGEEVIQLAEAILQDQPYQKETLLQSTLIDLSNVRISRLQMAQILEQQGDIIRQQDKLDEQKSLYQNQTTTLYTVLGLLILSVVLGISAWVSLRAKNAANVLLAEKNEEILAQRNQILEIAERAREATQAKLQFFTNISHEFRTPLTLILGPVEDAIQTNPNLDHTLRSELEMVRQNALRLLRLVNQLMDFRKIEHGKMRLQAENQDLVGLTRHVMKAFESHAQRRKIDFQLITEHAEVKVWVDSQMLDKVLFNLLSNAFKFTEDYGQIRLYIGILPERDMVQLKVSDSGLGMSPDQVQQAFDRFYQGNPRQGYGTGLGLALSKELIQLHKGTISVTSEEQVGTVFTILLPLGDTHLSADQLGEPIEMVASDASLDRFVQQGSATIQSTTISALKDHTVLLIEDYEPLRDFLRLKLGDNIHILEAPTGQDGIELALESVPDLVICDVMLPDMNGMDITAKLKEDTRTSHIPIIQLTAQTRTEQKIAGLKAGADVYMAKPFSMGYLTEQMNSLLRNRARLIERFQNGGHIIPQDLLKDSPDRKFLQTFTELVKEHHHNPDFNVNVLCQQLGMSRVQLYRKVKALLGYPVSDYIKQVRLEHAQQLLHNTKLTVAEIAYEVGFSTPAYFSTAFKGKFGHSPSSHRQSHQPN